MSSTIEHQAGAGADMGADANEEVDLKPTTSDMEEASPKEESPPAAVTGTNPTGGPNTKDVPWMSVQNGVDTSVVASIDEMKQSCYFLFPDWKTRLTRFWMLLILAAIIATAGVIGNSTATVIGASK